MKNPFDRQIADTINSKLGNIKASDDLIARTLARVNEETSDCDNKQTTHLSAINMGYIRQHENGKNKKTTKYRRILLASIAAAAAALFVVNTAIMFSSSKDENKLSYDETNSSISLRVSEKSILEDTITDMSDFVDYDCIYVSATKNKAPLNTRAGNSAHDHIQRRPQPSNNRTL